MNQTERQRHPGAKVPAVSAHQVVGTDKYDAQRDCRLDDARRRRDDVERRQRERDAVADRERRDDADQRQPGATEEQKANEEQDVIGSDEDGGAPDGMNVFITAIAPCVVPR